MAVKVIKMTNPKDRDPLWAFKSDIWRTIAMAIRPVCVVLVVYMVVHYAPAWSVPAFSALGWLGRK